MAPVLQIALGLTLIAATLGIHLVAVNVSLNRVTGQVQTVRADGGIVAKTVLIMVYVMFLCCARLVEAIIWALAFVSLDVVTEFWPAVYFAIVTLTTLGYGDVAGAFAISEAPVAIVVLAALGLIMVIKDNWRAVTVLHIAIALGAVTIGASTFAFQQGAIGPLAWMIISGAGLYVAYTPFSAMLFDRLMAAAQFPGTATYLIYLADASGYAGSVSLLITKEIFAPDLPWLPFFIGGAYTASAIGCVLTIASLAYFAKSKATTNSGLAPAAGALAT